MKRTLNGNLLIVERCKFGVACALDHFPSLCWGQLAMWAMGYAPWWTIFGVFLPSKELGNESFRQHCRWKSFQRYPYCGKCWKGDRWLEGCTDQEKETARQVYPPPHVEDQEAPK